MSDPEEIRPAADATPAVPAGDAGGRRTHRRRLWPAAIAAGVAVHVMGFSLFRVAPPRHAPAPAPGPGIAWLGSAVDVVDTSLGGQLMLKDPKPLFLPTRWNATLPEGGGVAVKRPGDIFDYDEAQPIVPLEASPPGLVAIPEGITRAAEAVRRFQPAYFSAVGRVDAAVAPVTPRLARIEIRDAQRGNPVLSQVVSPGAAPAGASWPFWAPFEMFVRVEATGLLGPPLVPAPGSGSEAVDAFFQGYVQNRLRLDLRLPAGYYLVRVLP